MLLKELSHEGRSAVEIAETWMELDYPAGLLRENLPLPELSEVDVVRHYTNLSRKNFGVDNGFYPLGSCTMKYNPKINEDLAALEGFTSSHPLSPEDAVQGNMQVLFEMDKMLSEITGMHSMSLQPAAGAHGELACVMMMKAHFISKDENRRIILIPDSAHGTNPASAAHCGFVCQEVKSDSRGNVDLEHLRSVLTADVAGMMLTFPNTLGLFDTNITEIARMLHENGSLLYIDVANMNAMLGMVRPGDLGADLIQLNLHKSFSTPHGCGGPGSGPIGASPELAPLLPGPHVAWREGRYVWVTDERSIGKVHSYFGNFGVIVKAYSYIRSVGAEGLRKAALGAVINANYMRVLLKDFRLPYDRRCAHEFVISDEGMPNGVTTAQIAKRLLDYGYHSPTIYFPLIVHGAMMIEPTETESKETMDGFIETMRRIRMEAELTPEAVKNAPHTLPVKLLDGVKAAREPDLRW